MKIPAGKNGNPNFITFFNMLGLILCIEVLFKIIGDEKIKTKAEAIRFAIKTPETPYSNFIIKIILSVMVITTLKRLKNIKQVLLATTQS